MNKMIRRLLYGKPVIIVSGLPRSGTSLSMQMLHAGGIPAATDEIRKSDIDNPKGYFELEQVKDLDKGGDKSWLSKYKGHVVKVISFLLMDLPDNLNYQVIFVERDIEEVLASQKKMLVRRNEDSEDIDDAKMRENFKNHLFRIRAFLKHSKHIESCFIRYKDMVHNPVSAVDKICAFLRMPLNKQAMVESVDPSLYRNRAAAENK